MNPSNLSGEPPPAGEILEVDTPCTTDLPTAKLEERTYRFDHVVDGFYSSIIAVFAREYFDARQPASLHMERDQAGRFAETVRKHIEAHPDMYSAIPITRATFHQAFERVIMGWAGRRDSSQ